MPVMGFTKFERLFRVAGGVDVDRDDVQRYLDFVNDALYDWRMSLRGDIDRIKSAIGEERWPPAAIAIFACGGRGLYTEVPLPEYLPDRVIVDERPYPRPMLNSGGASLLDHETGADLRFPLPEPPDASP